MGKKGRAKNKRGEQGCVSGRQPAYLLSMMSRPGKSLGYGQDVIGRAAHAQSKDVSHELAVAVAVAVEESYWLVALVAITRLATSLTGAR